MRRSLLVSAALASLPSLLGAQSGGASFSEAEPSFAADLAYLSSDAMDGRGTGTAGNQMAALFIVQRYIALRLVPVFTDSTCSDALGCTSLFIQRFRPPAHILARAALPADAETQNIAAVLPGSDPVLRREVIIVGAHYDHVGRSGTATYDVAVHNGADDNASGTVAVLELARRLRANPPRRTVMFVNFGAEEIGLVGSAVFVQHPPVPLASMVAMINLDMIGRLRGNRVSVLGVRTAPGLAAIVDSAGQGMPLKVSTSGKAHAPSDHRNFAARQIPVLHFFTGVHPDYHKPTDDVARINFVGLAQVVDLTERVLRLIADREDRLAPAGIKE